MGPASFFHTPDQSSYLHVIDWLKIRFYPRMIYDPTNLDSQGPLFARLVYSENLIYILMAQKTLGLLGKKPLLKQMLAFI